MWFFRSAETEPAFAPRGRGIAPRGSDKDDAEMLQMAELSQRGVRVKRTPTIKEQLFLATQEVQKSRGEAEMQPPAHEAPPQPPSPSAERKRREAFQRKSKATPLFDATAVVVEPARTELNTQRTARAAVPAQATDRNYTARMSVAPQTTDRNNTARAGVAAQTTDRNHTARFTERQVEKAKVQLKIFENDLNTQEKRLMLEFKRAKRTADNEQLDVENMQNKARMIRYYRKPASPPASSYERNLARQRLYTKSPIKAKLEQLGPRVYS